MGVGTMVFRNLFVSGEADRLLARVHRSVVWNMCAYYPGGLDDPIFGMDESAFRDAAYQYRCACERLRKKKDAAEGIQQPRRKQKRIKPGWFSLWKLQEEKRKARILPRPICGAICKSTGEPCKKKAMWCRTRCKWHGGMSTGPRTKEGKAAIAASNKRRAEWKRYPKDHDFSDFSAESCSIVGLW